MGVPVSVGFERANESEWAIPQLVPRAARDSIDENVPFDEVHEWFPVVARTSPVADEDSALPENEPVDTLCDDPANVIGAGNEEGAESVDDARLVPPFDQSNSVDHSPDQVGRSGGGRVGGIAQIEKRRSPA
jgi:hypothetical protein